MLAIAEIAHVGSHKFWQKSVVILGT